ncbi:t-SNARE complex subunit (syntaxin) [Paenibacillus sp. PastF-1]|nr:t-SNARE complex subunit (syntaxin) [Paenibacillus sp. PastF-2]MDF9850997.1 t-SNARE complex subunit (syntaxin) [Paenibacillus sp. PastM-2]MDF9857568.1 t-SNARE complex subunit (syntaxin) [Paenibacillus sp. PastF-1]MDH6482791.1 t-SNARE complex subunit (syntaxin) [Paenibacillus sp. PastH-2]MDH6510217.1 t-SNARE complex subunit (syntaxin) [Paenibacillus sp. PastM-3]
MENEKDLEIQELKKRIAFLENQVQSNNPQSSNILRFGITFILVFVVLLVLFGVFQFITPTN